VDHTDPADPLGGAPPAGLVEKHAVFRAAHQALDLPDAGADEEQMSEGQLRARVVAARREEVWAPRYVADELDATHEALRTARADATIWAARAAAEPDPHEAAQLRDAANTAQERADQLAEQVDALTAADDARSLWLIETSITRDRAERARQALSWRGIDVDSPDDRVTAQEWLDADHAAKLAADPDRPITEHDLAPDDVTHADRADANTDQDVTAPDVAERNCADDEPAMPRHDDDGADEQGRADDAVVDDPVDGPADDGRAADDRPLDDRTRPVAHDVDESDVEVVDTDVPEVEVLDIRDTASPDAGERIDPQQRRRVPLPDETAATVNRARLGVAEIEARRAVEAAALDSDPEPIDDLAALDGFDPEDERRDDLIRWANDHNDSDGRANDHASGCSDKDDGEALGR
jgi:hypothetical protein